MADIRFIVLSCPHKIATKYDYIVCAHKAITPGLDPNDFRSVANMDTTFVILQNGVGNEEPFRQSFPYSTIISCVVSTLLSVMREGGTTRLTDKQDMGRRDTRTSWCHKTYGV